tara:strand:+ start:928 stop:1125 length:198 start_codon:yes stop_codon:yes gene_type:complete
MSEVLIKRDIVKSLHNYDMTEIIDVVESLMRNHKIDRVYTYIKWWTVYKDKSIDLVKDNIGKDIK